MRRLRAKPRRSIRSLRSTACQLASRQASPGSGRGRCPDPLLQGPQVNTEAASRCTDDPCRAASESKRSRTVVIHFLEGARRRRCFSATARTTSRTIPRLASLSISASCPSCSGCGTAARRAAAVKLIFWSRTARSRAAGGRRGPSTGRAAERAAPRRSRAASRSDRRHPSPRRQPPSARTRGSRASVP